MEKVQSKYLLKPGALLQAFGDESKTMTNSNITDELAEWHLKNNPGVAIYFSRMAEAPSPAPAEVEIVPVEVKEPETVKEPEVKKTQRRPLKTKV